MTVLPYFKDVWVAINEIWDILGVYLIVNGVIWVCDLFLVMPYTFIFGVIICMSDDKGFLKIYVQQDSTLNNLHNIITNKLGCLR